MEKLFRMMVADRNSMVLACTIINQHHSEEYLLEIFEKWGKLQTRHSLTNWYMGTYPWKYLSEKNLLLTRSGSESFYVRVFYNVWLSRYSSYISVYHYKEPATSSPSWEIIDLTK